MEVASKGQMSVLARELHLWSGSVAGEWNSGVPDGGMGYELLETLGN